MVVHIARLVSALILYYPWSVKGYMYSSWGQRHTLSLASDSGLELLPLSSSTLSHAQSPSPSNLSSVIHLHKAQSFFSIYLMLNPVMFSMCCIIQSTKYVWLLKDCCSAIARIYFSPCAQGSNCKLNEQGQYSSFIGPSTPTVWSCYADDSMWSRWSIWPLYTYTHIFPPATYPHPLMLKISHDEFHTVPIFHRL